MNYQIRTVVQIQGGTQAGLVGIPGSIHLQGPPVDISDMPVDGDVILSCRNLTVPGDTSNAFYRKIVLGSVLQTQGADLSGNTYLLLIGTPTL